MTSSNATPANEPRHAGSSHEPDEILDTGSGSDSCPEPGEEWRERAVNGGSEDTLWDQLSSRRYQEMRIWGYVEDDWVPGAGYRPLLVLGADDETCQRGSALVHVIWDDEMTTSTPDDVRFVTDVKADTPLTPLAPAIGHFSFKPVPGLREWAESDEGDDKLTWDRYCFHRISYDKCGRDVIEFEKKLGNDLVQCAGKKWETLAQGRRWDWLIDAHERRDRLRAGQTPKKVEDDW